VIAVDTNILIYAFRDDSPFFEAAKACLSSLTQGRGAWCVPWPCVHEFLSVSTNPRIFKTPAPMPVALQAFARWQTLPNLSLLSETSSHAETLSRLLLATHLVGPRVHDARIAAICIDHGVAELWSADRDFGRFPELKVVNPLVRN
jgi:uncharacterized protein